MLLKKHRITKDKEYEKIFKLGKASYSKILGVRTVKNELDYSRFGIIISNKTSKQAVTRNFYKRQLRNIIFRELNNIAAGYDIAIIVQKRINETNCEDIKKDLLEQFKKLRITK